MLIDINDTSRLEIMSFWNWNSSSTLYQPIVTKKQHFSIKHVHVVLMMFVRCLFQIMIWLLAIFCGFPVSSQSSLSKSLHDEIHCHLPSSFDPALETVSLDNIRISHCFSLTIFLPTLWSHVRSQLVIF